MKKISLQSIMDKEQNAILTNIKKYRIFLAWGVTNLFKNKKKAAIYQSSLNEWINDMFYELNSIYANLLYLYRSSWVYTPVGLDSAVNKSFRNIEISIHKLFRSEYRGRNGAFYAFEAIESICNELETCNNELIAYYYFKKDWQQIKELEINARQLKRILRELKETSDPGSLGTKLRRED